MIESIIEKEFKKRPNIAIPMDSSGGQQTMPEEVVKKAPPQTTKARKVITFDEFPDEKTSSPTINSQSTFSFKDMSQYEYLKNRDPL